MVVKYVFLINNGVGIITVIYYKQLRYFEALVICGLLHFKKSQNKYVIIQRELFPTSRWKL